MNIPAAIQASNSESLFNQPLMGQSPARPGPGKLDQPERVFLNQIRPDQAREFLSRNINERLNRLGDFSQANSRNQYRNDHSSPQATANRIMEMAKQLLQNSQATAGQITNAVNEGLRNGRDALEQRVGLPAAIDNDIRNIASALQQGFQSPPFTQSTEQTQTRLSQYSSQASASIQLETRDGDIVTIELNRQQQQASSSIQYQADGVSLVAAGLSRSTRSEFQISVRGQLDESEQQAIQQFMGQIETVADKLQNGSLEEVMDEAASLRMDNSQLASFSVKLRSIEEYRSVEQYQQTQTSAQPLNQSLGTTPLNNFAEELSNIVNNLLEKVQIREPEQAVGTTLREMLKLQQPEQDFSASIEKLIQSLSPAREV